MGYLEFCSNCSEKNDYGNRNKKYNNGSDSSNKKSSFNVEDDFDFVD